MKKVQRLGHDVQQGTDGDGRPIKGLGHVRGWIWDVGIGVKAVGVKHMAGGPAGETDGCLATICN